MNQNKFSDKILPYICIGIMVLVCWYFGSKKLFTKVGFSSIAVVFAIAVVLALVLAKPLSRSVSIGDDSDVEDD